MDVRQKGVVFMKSNVVAAKQNRMKILPFFLMKLGQRSVQADRI